MVDNLKITDHKQVKAGETALIRGVIVNSYIGKITKLKELENPTDETRAYYDNSEGVLNYYKRNADVLKKGTKYAPPENIINLQLKDAKLVSAHNECNSLESFMLNKGLSVRDVTDTDGNPTGEKTTMCYPRQTGNIQYLPKVYQLHINADGTKTKTELDMTGKEIGFGQHVMIEIKSFVGKNGAGRGINNIFIVTNDKEPEIKFFTPGQASGGAISNDTLAALGIVENAPDKDPLITAETAQVQTDTATATTDTPVTPTTDAPTATESVNMKAPVDANIDFDTGVIVDDDAFPV